MLCPILNSPKPWYVAQLIILYNSRLLWAKFSVALCPIQTLAKALSERIGDENLNLNTEVLELSSSQQGNPMRSNWTVSYVKKGSQDKEEKHFDAVILTVGFHIASPIFCKHLLSLLYSFCALTFPDFSCGEIFDICLQTPLHNMRDINIKKDGVKYSLEYIPEVI